MNSCIVLAGVPVANWAAEIPNEEWVPEPALTQMHLSLWETTTRGSQETALPAGESGKTGPSESDHLIILCH